jgi:hypothetical protein
MDKPASELLNLIAHTIKDADNSFLFEDYVKQATKVLDVLHKEGFHLLPLEPNEAMINAGKVAISYGATKPTELIKNIYNSMVKAYTGI